MKKSTKIKIGVSILLCILLLALIGQKSKENFKNQEIENFQNNINLKGNQNPNAIVNDNSLGFDIEGSTPNILMSIEEKPKCHLNKLTEEERSKEINNDKDEYRQQLENHVKNFLEKNKNKKLDSIINSNLCYLQFPAIL